MPLDNTPILVGAYQKTWKVAPEDLSPALGMLEEASRGALADAGVGSGTVDKIATIEFTINAPYFQGMDLPQPSHPSQALKRVLGAEAARTLQVEGPGGNSPQQLVNHLAEEIAQGRTNVALITGAEFMHSYWTLVQSGAAMDHWREDDPAPDETIGVWKMGESELERANGIDRPTNGYPLIENAIRAARGASVAEHMASMGRLMAPLTKVAAANPGAWFPVERSAGEIATENAKNRMVGFPYTKYMNAIIRVDMAAALVMTSVGKARELGIPEEKWVYLHGCADATDIWNMTERPDLTRSPAIKGCWDRASTMAGKGLPDLKYFDIYSCFPSALEIACREIGLAEDDSRGLTVTGGLPFFGGPGNNYAMHGIAEMMATLRADPGSFGLCTANGWYITKHAMGIYSTAPVEGEWSREDPSVLQAEIDAMPKVPVNAIPNGPGRVETCTVIYGREGPMMGIVIGRMDDGRRFVAQTDLDDATISALRADDAVGYKGTVKPVATDGLKNHFVFD